MSRTEATLALPRPLDVERARDLLRGCRDIDTILAIRDAAKVSAEFRRVTGAGREAENEAREIVLRAQRRFGEFLREAARKPEEGRPRRSVEARDTSFRLDDLGVTRDESSRCQRLAAIPEPVFEEHVAAVQRRGEKLTTAGTIAATSASAGYDSDEWYTPDEYVEAAREVMGGIDLDPASHELAQERIRAGRFFTKADDGLKRRWSGRIWLNPPYSQPAATDFADKLLAEYRAGRVVQAVMLQNSSTDTAWFHRMAAEAWMCLVRGRINFLRAGGGSVGNRNAQVFFYLGREQARFAEVFRRFGLVGKLEPSV